MYVDRAPNITCLECLAYESGSDAIAITLAGVTHLVKTISAVGSYGKVTNLILLCQFTGVDPDECVTWSALGQEWLQEARYHGG